MKKYEDALKFATQKHKGQFRIGGLPYITHPVGVAEILKKDGYDLKYQITALFHDLLEDTDTTEKDILFYGDEEILSAVKLLTKTDGYDMPTYIKNIRENPLAFAVKGADRLHNLICAFTADEEFKKRYVYETVQWYLDFNKGIPQAVKSLALSLKEKFCDLPFLYEPIDKWDIKK